MWSIWTTLWPSKKRKRIKFVKKKSEQNDCLMKYGIILLNIIDLHSIMNLPPLTHLRGTHPFSLPIWDRSSWIKYNHPLLWRWTSPPKMELRIICVLPPMWPSTTYIVALWRMEWWLQEVQYDTRRSLWLPSILITFLRIKHLVSLWLLFSLLLLVFCFF